MYLNVALDRATGGGARWVPRPAWRAGNKVAIAMPILRVQVRRGIGAFRRGVGDCQWVNGSWVNVLPNGSVEGCGAPPTPAPITGGSAAAGSIANFYQDVIAANPYLSSPAYLAAEAAAGAPEPAGGAAADAAATLKGYCEQNQFNNVIWGTPLDTATCKGATPLPGAVATVGQVTTPNYNFGATPLSVVNKSPLAAPASGGGGGAPAPQPATATLKNMSRPGQPFQSGDSWQLVITGTPGQPVSDSASQNGKSLGTTAYGNMPSSGQLVLSGSFDDSVVGDWREMWTVGTAAAPVLAFTVKAAPVPAGAVSKREPTVIGTMPTASYTAIGPVGNPVFDWLTADVNVFGFDVPVLALAAAGIGAVWLFSGSGRGR